jgi:truncated hemoglobin YjbI
MAMTKQHVESIARCIGEALREAGKDEAQAQGVLSLAERLVSKMQQASPRFDKTRVETRVEHWRVQ